MIVAPSRRLNLLLLAVVIFFAASVFMLFNSPGIEAGQIIANGSFLAIGALIVVRRPRNIIGPIMVVTGVFIQVTLALMLVAEVAVADGDLDTAGWLALVTGVFSPLILWLVTALVFLFPHGRTESMWAKRLLIGSGALAAVTTVVTVFTTPTTFVTRGPEEALPHPFIDAATAESLGWVEDLYDLILAALLLVAAGILIARTRHSDAIERRQIGWLATAVAVYGLIITPALFMNEAGTLGDSGFLFVDAIGFTLIPIAIGIAIMRYRLYDIDTIINRSLIFGALAVFIGGVYIAIVVGIGELIGGGSGFGLSIVASVLVAMAFQPVRRRVERWANRLVYGERATPYEVLVRFSRRSAELSDEQLLDRIPHLIADGTGASQTALWVRTDGGFRTAALWPEDTSTRRVMSDEEFVDPEADYSLPVFHDGELLGGISLVKTGGETVTPPEEALLADLAAGMGLALRNAGLTGQLRKQVTELEASRERVLAAADAARRALENDLDRGPQQQLVALKVKLGPTRKRAEQLGEEKLAEVLAQLEEDAGEAIQAVRDFAGGIYPPLLEAEGLTAAITQQARKAAIPVSVHGNGAQRYSREIEAAVYFTVLESLQNTAKYADARSASVTLAEAGHELLFEVTDDGRGFDSGSVSEGAGLTGMADRLDTVGGQVRIESTPGHGAVVTGTVPIDQLVPA